MRSKIVVLMMLCALLAFSTIISAQGNSTLAPNTAQMASLNPEAPVGLFTLSGTQGDFVQIQLVALAADLQLSASLNNPSQQNIASSHASFGGNSASLSAYLPTTGIYTLLVGGNAGDYLISYSSVSAGTPQEITPQSAQSVLLDGTTPQIVTFNAPVDGAALSFASAGQYQASLVNSSGALLGSVNSVSACFVVAGNDSYTVVISTEEGSSDLLNLTLGSDCGAGVNASSTSGPVQLPETTTSTDPNICTATSNTAVNVRNGSGTEFAAIGTLPAGSPATVTGRTPNNWLQVQFGGGSGFVFADVVSLNGPCQNIASVASSSPPANQGQQGQQQPTQPPAQQQQQPTGQPTQPPAQGQPTQPPVAPTEAPTQPAANIAPPNSSFALNVRLDETATLSDYVSYPEGNTEDVISWRAEGLNPSVAVSGGQADFTVRFSCSGTGTEHILFRVGQDTYNCNETYTRRVNADSNTGAIRVIATGGSNTYVQWTLNVSLPRTN